MKSETLKSLEGASAGNILFTERVDDVFFDAEGLARRESREAVDITDVLLALVFHRFSMAKAALGESDGLEYFVGAVVLLSERYPKPQQEQEFITTPQAIAEASVLEASRLGHRYVGTGHLLLAMLNPENGENEEIKVLAESGINYAQMLANLKELLK